MDTETLIGDHQNAAEDKKDLCILIVLATKLLACFSEDEEREEKESNEEVEGYLFKNGYGSCKKSMKDVNSQSEDNDDDCSLEATHVETYIVELVFDSVLWLFDFKQTGNFQLVCVELFTYEILNRFFNILLLSEEMFHKFDVIDIPLQQLFRAPHVFPPKSKNIVHQNAHHAFSTGFADEE